MCVYFGEYSNVYGPDPEMLILMAYTVKPVLSSHSNRRPKLVFKTDYRLMQVKSIAYCSKLPFVIKIFVLSIFE